MKILLYVTSHLPDIGGREIVAHNLALQYQSKGHQVLVSGPAGFRRHRHVELGYPVRRHPVVTAAPDLSRMLSLSWTSLKGQFDVLHAHATYPVGYVATRVRAISRTPVVITPHGEDINVLPDIDYGQRLDPEQAPKIEHAVRHADGLTAISDTVFTSLLDAGAAEAKICKISNGVDVARFAQAEPAGMKARYGFSDSTLLVATIGNYRPLKGQESLVASVLEAGRQGADIGLVIVGRTDDDFRASVAARDAQSRVHFTGPIAMPMPGSEDDDLARLLKAADVYASTSIGEGAEGLSLSLLEAMAAGCCPLVTDISGNRDVIADQVNGLVVPPGDDPALTQALMKLHDDAPMRARLAEEAHGKALDFSWSAIADEYLSYYEEVAAR